MKLSDLQRDPNPLSQYYQHFDVVNRLLFTGHSHQAWPDCGLAGQIQAWQDAATYVDKKWARAEEKAEQVRQGFARLLGDDNGDFALGQNTFDLVLRFLSALPLQKKPKIVTSDSEFHSLRRLLNRLGEEGLEVVMVPSAPLDTFVARLCQAIDNKTAAVCCSKVFYNSGLIVDDLSPIATQCLKTGCELLIDAYHCLNVVPFSIEAENLHNAYVVGGGYKYCQLGEGNCFLRLPKDCSLRPIATGWYGEFANLSESIADKTLYAEGPARFAGATYDPTSHYRATEVFEFFQTQSLTPALLRNISQHQLSLLQSSFLNLDLDPSVIHIDTNIGLKQRGGFLTFYATEANRLCEELYNRGVHCDNRGSLLRFGPAPYHSDSQCIQAMQSLKKVVNNL